jgi:hypothetical protein
VKTDLECERARIQLMALRDGETDARDSRSIEHVSQCDACRHWQTQMASLGERLVTVQYPTAPVDLWARVASRIRESERPALPIETLWAIGAGVLALRALQLVIDLPLPWLHPIVAVAVAALIVRRVGGDFVAIATFAPELQKRGL